MRRPRGWDQNDALHAKRFGDRSRDDEVTVMNWVKRAAKEQDISQGRLQQVA